MEIGFWTGIEVGTLGCGNGLCSDGREKERLVGVTKADRLEDCLVLIPIDAIVGFTREQSLEEETLQR